MISAAQFIKRKYFNPKKFKNKKRQNKTNKQKIEEKEGEMARACIEITLLK